MRRGRRRRTRLPPPMLERRRSTVPSTAEPVKTSSSASALIVIASFPEELLPSPIVRRVKCLIRGNGNGFPRFGRNLLVHCGEAWGMAVLVEQVREPQEIGDVPPIRDEPIDPSALSPRDHLKVPRTASLHGKTRAGPNSHRNERQWGQGFVP